MIVLSKSHQGKDQEGRRGREKVEWNILLSYKITFKNVKCFLKKLLLN